MASSTSTPAPSISRPTPTTPAFNQPSTPAQLFYGARGRSGSIASSFARQQAANRDQTHSPPPLPPLPASHTAPNNTLAHHTYSSSTSSFPRSSTFPSLSSPIRTTFPGSPVRSTFADVLPPIRAGESFSIGETRSPSPSKSGSGFTPVQRNPSPLGHGHSLSLALPASTRGQNRNTSGTNTWSSASVHSVASYHPPNAMSSTTIHKHTTSSSTNGEQIPLGRLPSKQSREALIPALAGTGTGGGNGRNSGYSGKGGGGSSPSFGAMLFNAGKRASLSFGGGREKDKSELEAREKAVAVVRASPDVPDLVGEPREKEKGWGDSVGGIRTPRESIVKFTRARSRSPSLESQTQARSNSGESSRAQPIQTKPIPIMPPSPHVHVVDPDQPRQRQSTTTDGLPSSAFRPSDSTAFGESSRNFHPRRSQLQSGWQLDQGPIVKDDKTGRVVRQHELIASESRWFCAGRFVTGGGTRRVPVKERKAHPYAAGGIDEGDGWAYSDGTSYVYDAPQTGSSHPIAASEEKGTKRGRLSLVPYPFVFSVLLVLGTSGTWIATTCVWWWRHLSPAVAAVGAWLVLLVVVSMARTAFTDPGIVPRNLDLSPVMEEDNTPYARDLYVRGIP
ncbi:Eukaryotic peptide chain release factor GTP-binding subunit [Ceratobasidium sp. 395]|nr:Eukaryotic peptide chain release factor GTP-binding subunit [Ceratobasidium sp. 395]